MQLTKRQKNEIFEILVAKDIDPAECEIGNDYPVMAVQHWPTESHIYCSADVDGYYAGEMKVGGVSLGDFSRCDWDEFLEQVESWADEVKYEVSTPDFWEELKRQPEILAEAQDSAASNTTFTPDEQAAISSQIREIKMYLKESGSLSDEQMSRVEARLDEAEKASRRIGRKDWLLLFSGTIFTLIVTDLLTPDIAQHILMLTLHGLGHLFAGGIKPIAGPPIK